MMLPIAHEAWSQGGPLFALVGVLLAIAALGWDPALRALTAGDPPPSQFRFQPRVIAPAVLLAVLMVASGLLVLVALAASLPLLLLATPVVLIATEYGVLAIARARYRRRLGVQIGLAVAQLAAMTSGSAAVLSAFRSVGRASAWPLQAEWAWVEAHINVPYTTTEAGRVQTRHSDHAHALRALADQTPLELHARVLDHLAAIYEQGAESHAPMRLRQLAEVLAQQSSLQRALRMQLGRVRAEAFVIAGAMGLIAIWLLVSQPERVATAFLESPFGPLAALWFSFWLVLPIAAGLVLTRVPELPL